jgi:hypothetical protein
MLPFDKKPKKTFFLQNKLFKNKKTAKKNIRSIGSEKKNFRKFPHGKFSETKKNLFLYSQKHNSN